jgi:hypothetical protein
LPVSRIDPQTAWIDDEDFLPHEEGGRVVRVRLQPMEVQILKATLD